MIYQEEFVDIRALARQGLTYAEIGRLIGRDWRTVKRYLTEDAQPVYHRNVRTPSKLDPLKPVIDTWLRDTPHLRATRIHQDLVRDYGFTGSYQIVQRYVKEKKAIENPPQQEERFETAPGLQAQVDWSYEEPITGSDGITLPLYGFHMVLSHSRDSFVQPVGSMDLATFWGCHRAAFAHFGGVPKQILYDRTKTVVRRHVGVGHGLGETELHPEAIAFACHYGFSIRLCRPYRAKTKGKVESDIDYVRGRLFRAHSFRSYEEANAAWHEWNEEIARRRVHGTHGEVVSVRADRDRDALLLLPARPYLVSERTQRTVARDGFLSFEGRRYLVPSSLARTGDRVELLVGKDEIEVRSVASGALLCSYLRGAPEKVLSDPDTDCVSLAAVLQALPEQDVHRRPLSLYEEALSDE